MRATKDELNEYAIDLNDDEAKTLSYICVHFVRTYEYDEEIGDDEFVIQAVHLARRLHWLANNEELDLELALGGKVPECVQGL